MTLRCALYARDSSDQQRAASIADQFRICREHAGREGWKIAGAYRDPAVSGDSVIPSPGVERLPGQAGDEPEVSRKQFPVPVHHHQDHAPRPAPVRGSIRRLMEDGPNLVGCQVARTFQMRLRHPVQHRVVADPGKKVDAQFLEGVERLAARKACVHPHQHAAAGKRFEQGVRSLQRENMGLLRAVLGRIAQARSQDVPALAAYRHHRMVALVSDIAVVAAAGLLAVNQQRNIVDVDRHPARCRGAAPPESLPQSANRALQHPLSANRALQHPLPENVEILLAAQYAEKAGQGRL